MTAVLTLREDKGQALTHSELDDNFTYLNQTKVEKTGATPTVNNLVQWDSTSLVKDSGQAISAILNADNHTTSTTNGLFTAVERAKLGYTKAMKISGSWQTNLQSGGIDTSITQANLSWSDPNTLTITHNIGHTNYVAIVQPENSYGAQMICTNKSANSVQFRGYQPNGGTVNIHGFYVVFYYT